MPPARTPMPLEHLTRGQRRVVIHRLPVMRDVTIGVVQQLAAQCVDGAVGLHRFVHEMTGPSRPCAVIEAQLVVGIPVGRANPSAQVEGDARDAEACDLIRRRVDGVSNLIGERWRDPLVGVERKNPVVAGQRGGEVFLGDIARPGAHHDAGPALVRDTSGVVGALAVDHDDFVGEGNRFEGRPDVGGLVPGNDDGRDGRHGLRV